MIKKIASGNLPFSKAIVFNARYIMEVSGQVGLDPMTGKLVEGIENQTKQSLDNLKKIVEDEGWSTDDLVKVRIFLTDMNDYDKMNEVYKKYFQNGYPSRVALAVKGLPLGALIEIECTLAKD